MTGWIDVVMHNRCFIWVHQIPVYLIFKYKKNFSTNLSYIFIMLRSVSKYCQVQSRRSVGVVSLYQNCMFSRWHAWVFKSPRRTREEEEPWVPGIRKHRLDDSEAEALDEEDEAHLEMVRRLDIERKIRNRERSKAPKRKLNK